MPPAPSEGHAGEGQDKGRLGAGGNGNDRSQRAPCRYSYDAGIGHRVAEETLHHRPGNAQGGANNQGQGNSGHAYRRDNRLLGLGCGGLPDTDLAKKDIDGVREGNGVGAKRNGSDHEGQPKQHKRK